MQSGIIESTLTPLGPTSASVIAHPVGGPPAAGIAPLVGDTHRPVRRHRWVRTVRRLVGPLVLLSVWQFGDALGIIDNTTMAPPIDVIRAFDALHESGELWTHLSTSLGRAGKGLVLGSLIGLALAVLSGLFRAGEDLIDVPMQMLRTMPFIALTPLFIVWFGIDETPKIALITLGTSFPMYINAYAGIRNVDAKLIESAQTLGLGRMGLVRHVVLPGALPQILVGLRYSMGISVLALVAAEQINAKSGIGYLMTRARDFGRIDIIVAALVIYCVLGLAADMVVRLLERSLLTWRRSFTGS